MKALRSGAAVNRLVRLLMLVSVISTSIFSITQTTNVPVAAKEDLLHRISVFSSCLKSRQAGCVAQSISSQGITLGVDGPRVSADSLVRKLLVDHAMQCLFWGSHCASSMQCSVLKEIVKLDEHQIGPPRSYGKYWQIDAESKSSGQCTTGLPFVFQLEDGYWKLVALPYT